MQFAYDARNRCIKRVTNGTTTYLTYDGWSLIEERDTGDNVLASYIHGARIDEILTLTSSRFPLTPFYYHHDGLGSTTHVTDGTGALAESYQYDVYGTATVYDSSFIPHNSSLVGNRFLFTGREYLADLGLYDYRNRFYSPSLGRFLQTDPIRFWAADVNLYRYVHNTLVGTLDSYGLSPESEFLLELELAIGLQNQAEFLIAHPEIATEWYASPEAVNSALDQMIAEIPAAWARAEKLAGAAANSSCPVRSSSISPNAAPLSIGGATGTIGVAGAIGSLPAGGVLTGAAGLGVAAAGWTGVGVAGAAGYGVGRGLNYISGGRIDNGVAWVFRPVTDLFY